MVEAEARTRAAYLLRPRARRGRGMLIFYVRGRGEDEVAINSTMNSEGYPRRSSSFEDEDEG